MGKISTNQWKHDKKFNRRILKISFLPSNWNLDKIALAGELGQVLMSKKKKFPIFTHAGRWLFLLLNL